MTELERAGLAAMTGPTDKPWYKNAVIYSLDVRTFQDSDADGVGDFDGLSSRLDYLSGLGVTALWLLPFFPTSGFDAGYDVTDYFDVDPAVGGMRGFVSFMRHAQERGLRVIVDLPLNHTSIDHPWFQEARAHRDSPYRDYYIWVDEPPANSPEQVVFRGDAPQPWTYDDEAGQYYLHRFYEQQPDLDHANPAVRAEIFRILEFWLRLGAAGVRLDAAPYVAEKSAADPTVGSVHEFLGRLHEHARSVRPDAVLMAEADVQPDELAAYFGPGGGVHMLFDFLLNNYFFLALARKEAEPLQKVFGMLPDRPPDGQWINWVRNHDELDLERLTTHQRDVVYDAFAPEDDMRIYGRGIRRRFPPMVGGDRRRAELAYNLLFALPGTPMIRYGEEILMGDDLSLEQRSAVRTPMQWAPITNAGFSAADRDDLILPVIEDGDYGAARVNVATQQLDPGSFLARMVLLISIRRQTPEIGDAEPDVLDAGDPAVLALKYTDGETAVVTVHNLAEEDRDIAIASLGEHRFLFDLVSDRRYPVPHEGSWSMTIAGSGYRWFRVQIGGTVDDPSARAATRALRRHPR